MFQPATPNPHHPFPSFHGAAEATGLALFVLLLSTLVCCQPTELIWAFLFINFFVLSPPPQLSSSGPLLSFQWIKLRLLGFLSLRHFIKSLGVEFGALIRRFYFWGLSFGDFGDSRFYQPTLVRKRPKEKYRFSK